MTTAIGPSQLAGPLAAFLLILALIPLALWLLRRTRLGGGASGRAMRQVASLALAPNQRLVTVEVGQGDDRRWLVLGVSPGAISLLHHMPPQPEPGQVNDSRPAAHGHDSRTARHADRPPDSRATTATDSRPASFAKALSRARDQSEAPPKPDRDVH